MVWMLTLVLLGQQQAPFDRARLASQAQSFAEQLPNLIGTETLEQKSIRYATRMRIRVGEAALKPVPPKIRERRIRSEIGFVLRGNQAPVWSELRKVMDVDGKQVTAPKKARERLAFGLKSDDERERLRMMEEFMSYGLDGLATDYSLTLLLFRFGDIDKMRFVATGASEFIGADRVNAYQFSRADTEAGVTVFDGKQAIKQPLRGTIWLRAGDLAPLKIQLLSRVVQDKTVIDDEGLVEYQLSRYGAVVPRAVLYQRKVNDVLVLETRYEYQDFQKFGADAELKFTP
jgi:hypothetical protein